MWALNPMMCPYKGRAEGVQDRQQRRRQGKGGGHVTTEAERSDGATWVPTALESERQSTDPPQRSPGSVALLTLWFQTSDLQHCERASFCCFKPPSL